MRYSSDLSDKQWALIEGFLERPDPRGAVRRHSMREVINAIFYLTKTGCQWRLLPTHFPPWQTVYDHFRRLQARGVWEQMLLCLNQQVRKKKGAIPPPAISLSTPKVSKPKAKAKREASTGVKRSRDAAVKSRWTLRG